MNRKSGNKLWDLWVEGRADSPTIQNCMTYQSDINNGVQLTNISSISRNSGNFAMQGNKQF